MKIGFFDSGLGGLFLLSHVAKKLPQYDYIFLGDTKNLPYGDKSQKKIYDLAVNAIEYLFEQDCSLVIVACNTVSAQALRKIQQTWLPKSKYSDRKVLGIIRPTVETIDKNNNLVGLIGTKRTVDSSAYALELANINPKIKLVASSTPKLVPMIENDRIDEKVLARYVKRFANFDALILACTHYGLIKSKIKKILGPKVKIIAQEELIGEKLSRYLKKHSEIEHQLGKHNKIELRVTKLNSSYRKFTKNWFNRNLKLNLVRY